MLMSYIISSFVCLLLFRFISGVNSTGSFFSSSSSFLAGFNTISPGISVSFYLVFFSASKGFECIHRFEWIAQWYVMSMWHTLVTEVSLTRRYKETMIQSNATHSTQERYNLETFSSSWHGFRILFVSNILFFFNSIECLCLCVYMQISSSVFKCALRTWFFSLLFGLWKAPAEKLPEIESARVRVNRVDGWRCRKYSFQCHAIGPCQTCSILHGIYGGDINNWYTVAAIPITIKFVNTYTHRERKRKRQFAEARAISVYTLLWLQFAYWSSIFTNASSVCAQARLEHWPTK